MTPRRARVAAALLVAVLLGCGDEPQRPGTAGLTADKPPPLVITSRPSARPSGHRAPHEAVPILMYHVIGIARPQTPLPALWVKPHEFAAEVSALARAGYHGVTLQQVWDAWHHGGTLPHKPVVFSFDDGYAGQVRDALPALRRAGWPGVLNLELANLADMGGTRAVRRLIEAGWEIDSHTLTHPDLTTLSAAQLRHELAGSRTRIRRLFGVPANFFCYPSGRYDPTVIAAVRDAGYLAATTTEPGFADRTEPYALARVRVDGGLGAAGLLRWLRDLRSLRAG